MSRYLSLIIFLSFSIIAQLSAQNAVTPIDYRIDNSFYHIGINYTIEDDINLNSQLTLEYKVKGSSQYLSGALSMRAHPELIIDGIQQDLNYHAASACFLTPDTEYDIKLNLTDPDGGDVVTEFTTKTKSFPEYGTNVKYVSPGNGGGSGSLSNPFLGLQEAADNATAGDHFMVNDGTYSDFDLNVSGTENNPISFVSSNLHGAVIDGNNISTGILELGVFNDSLSYIMIDGFKIQNGRWGIDAQNTIHLTVQNCFIEDVDYGIVNRRANGWEHDQYFYNNTISGRTNWPQSGIPGERGIDIRGNNNVIAYNSINNFGDGISTDGPPYKTSYSLDIYNNDITEVVDDLIEVDGTVSNTRVYNNRGFNGRMGVSLAPIFGGPCYVFRNQFYNLETSAYKMNRGPSGLVIVNNSSVKILNGMSSDSGWQNTYFRNNLIVGSRYCFEEYGLVTGSNDDWDYDAFLSTRSGTSGNEWFKWDNVRYTDVDALNASSLLEENALEMDFSDFEDISIPASYTTSYNPSQRDLSPTSNSMAIDQGAYIENLNDPYVTDALTDLGFHEYGQNLPEYGADYTVASCTDGIKNGDEIYVDCGGSCTECNDCPYDQINITDELLPIDLNLKTSDYIHTNSITPINADVILSAENSIELNIGFETVLGAKILINISTCN